MASMGGGGFLDPEPFVRLVKNGGMLNSTLKSICSAEGLKTNGVKAELQNRIIEKIRAYANAQDEHRFTRLRRIIERPDSISARGYLNYGNSSSPAANQAPKGAPVFNYGGAAMQSQSYNNKVNGSGMRLEFKPSPFYTIQEQLGETKTCEARIANDPTLRVMVFCAGEANGKQDIAFPHQSEIKVNEGEVKANLRGLKNKPGSTLPVDITDELRLKIAGYQNKIEMTYALTTKAGHVQKFYLAIYVVKTVSVADLGKKLATGKRITKDLVVNDMISKARNADIVATASVLSLKCPISTLRIELPCRSVLCRHNQCFDATSYLQLQEQAPTWQCPICNNSAPFENLAVDEYVKDILQNTSRSVDQVTVEPEGKWSLYSKPDPVSTRNGVASDSEDDDLIVITRTNDKIHMSTPTRPPPANGTLTPATREPSIASAYSSRPNGSSISGKRPLPEVIDLTSSGDEDDGPPVERQPKRQMTGSYSSLPQPPPYRPNGYR
ncbi:hypothetical protein CJF32_00002693 [Rutstroemia sp. NJR-2017a WRK4]|nr:hypothetical protein CJF32_00006269 [Rutstroemia sp. NJR-2017a WRK4]PQE11887.1 hypothetical protein CJF32_00002693 [Rutstroemia sp. NJR-2017a WRK4]